MTGLVLWWPVQVAVYIQTADVQRRPYVRQVLRPASEALEAALNHFDRDMRRWRASAARGGGAAGSAAPLQAACKG
jgi:hypothetical protein